MTEPITVDALPGPRGLPLVGNIFDIDSQNPIESLIKLSREYGPIFRLATPGGTRVIASGAELVDEICDDETFDKKVGGGLAGLRKGSASVGLFTAETDDPLWHRAHNILMAPFSLDAMRAYTPMMIDIADQLMEKWDRLNPEEDVDVPADMTRLTLDTIALCGFGYRFNSFYRDTPHPFVAAMVRMLDESQARLRQLTIQTRLKVRAQRQLEEDQAFTEGLVDNLVAERRAQGDEAANEDLLGRMLTGVDKQTGKRLPDENIRAQCITFLIAGHETTSGLLSFAVYYLMKNPDVLAKAYEEVDRVLGGAKEPTYDQIHQLTYVRQILDESLRLWPTAPAFTRQPFEDVVLGGRYAIPKGTPITVLTPMLHRDTTIWGADAEDFNPDRMAPAKLRSIPPNAYKPFGTGQRACIGRQFALQEAVLVLGMVLQRFELVDYARYELKTKTTLTVKPDEMRIQVRRRTDRPLDRAPASAPASPYVAAKVLSSPAPMPRAAASRHSTPLTVLFGSNLGTAEGIATKLAQEGADRGFDVTLGPLDDHIGTMSDGGAALIVCSSYNGTPPDNAAKFAKWVRDPETASDSLSGVVYSVFGCGNSEWAATYQAVPTLLDDNLESRGAKRAHLRGEGDARDDFDARYRDWHASLWTDIANALDLPADVAEPANAGPRLAISVVNRQVTNPVIMSYRAQPAMIRANRELLHAASSDDQRSTGQRSTSQRSTRHIEIALPSGMTYRAGDHLGVLPRNDVETIRRVMQHFKLDAGMYVTIVANSGNLTHLPTDEPAPLLGVLGSCVELQDPATRGDIEAMIGYANDPQERADLEDLIADDHYREKVLRPNISMLDLLQANPSCEMPFDVFLALLPPLRPRYYSISSSPLASPEVASITTGVLTGAARSGDGVFTGVCSGHLAQSPENSTAFVFVREPTNGFRPPENPHTPMIMIGAGTGLAPFRGFLQERAALKDQGVPVGDSLLFFGCRDSAVDYLYEDELLGYADSGISQVATVFSRAPENDQRYVQHGLKAHADEVWNLIGRDASIFVCGNANTMAPEVRATLVDIFASKTGGSTSGGEAWLADLRADGRFVEDIWGG